MPQVFHGTILCPIQAHFGNRETGGITGGIHPGNVREALKRPYRDDCDFRETNISRRMMSFMRD